MADLDSASSVAAGSSPASAGDSSPAPASSASDTSSGAPSDARSIAAELLSETGAPAEAPPAPAPADPSQPAAATSGEDDADYQNLLASGHSIPIDRHKAVLTNARQKTRAEVEAEYRAKYAWADQYDRQRADQALGLMQAFDKNPEATLRTLAAAIGIPFGQMPQPQAPPEPEGPPEADVRLEDGSEFFTAKTWKAREAWLTKQFDQRLDSLQQQYRPLLEQYHNEQMRKQADRTAGDVLGAYRSNTARYPSFRALEPQIKQLMEADASLSLSDAYSAALEVARQTAQVQHVTDRASQLSRKAAASAPPPGAPSAVTPLRDRDRSTADIAREVAGVAGL